MLKRDILALPLIGVLALGSLYVLPTPVYAANQTRTISTSTQHKQACAKTKHHRAKKAQKKTLQKVQPKAPPNNACPGDVCPIHREKG